MAVPRKIILSFNSLEYMSYALSPRPVCSTTIGMSVIVPPFFNIRFSIYDFSRLLKKYIFALQAVIPAEAGIHNLLPPTDSIGGYNNWIRPRMVLSPIESLGEG